MAEEQRCQEGHLLCANNCGFFGSPATLNLCSKCYRDLRLKEEQASSAKIAVEKSFLLPPSSSSPPPIPSLPKPSSASTIQTSSPPAQQQQTGRCTSCRKRVGLTGFPCRCGMTFCGNHRLPEIHGCSFDYKAAGYKAAGREAIARSNPVVKASKIDRI